MKKKLSLMIVLIMLVLLGGCKRDDKLKIGILQLIEHEALTSARIGFLDYLEENGYEDVQVQLIIPSGDANTMQQGAKKIIRRNDLILGIATNAAISLKVESDKAKNNKPVLYTAVTDPIDAGLEGSNITGTNDLNPIAEQLALATELLPNIKKIGVLYNESETNSSLQAKEAIKVIKEMGLEAINKTFLDVSDLESVATSLARDVELIYAPTDNLLASNTGLLNKVGVTEKVPYIVGAETMVNDLPGLTIGIDYYELGRLTGKLAVEILNGKKPNEVPSRGLSEFKYNVNVEKLKQIGITIPDSILEKS